MNGLPNGSLDNIPQTNKQFLFKYLIISYEQLLLFSITEENVLPCCSNTPITNSRNAFNNILCNTLYVILLCIILLLFLIKFLLIAILLSWS